MSLNLKSSGGGGVILSPASTAVDVTVTVPAIASTLLTQADGSSNAVYTPAGTGAVATTVQTKLRESVSVKDFGAVADWNGTTGTDNTASIQAALTYAGTIPGGTVKLPAGQYKTLTALTIPSGVRLVGDGIDASVIRYRGAGTAINLAGSSGTHLSKVSVKDLSIFGDGTTSLTGIAVSWCDNSTFDYLRVYGFNVGVSIANSVLNQFNYVLADTNRQDGFNMTTDSTATTFLNCIGVSNTRAGIYIDGGRSISMYGCTWETNGSYGVYLTDISASAMAKSILMSGCYLEGNTSYEVFIDNTHSSPPAGISIKDNYFNCMSGKAATAIYVSSVSGLEVDGNTFDIGTATYSYAMGVIAAKAPTGVVWGSNLDKSTNPYLPYAETVYTNIQKTQPRAWAKFTLSGTTITLRKQFGVSTVTRIGVGVYEVTLAANATLPDLYPCINANASALASVLGVIVSVGPPSTTSVFRIYTNSATNTPIEAEVVSFLVNY